MYQKWYMYATSSRNFVSVRPRKIGPTLVELEFIKHIRRVVSATLTTCVHLARIIPLHTALLVPPKGIARQIRVFILEVLLCAVCLLGSLCL